MTYLEEVAAQHPDIAADILDKLTDATHRLEADLGIETTTKESTMTDAPTHDAETNNPLGGSPGAPNPSATKKTTAAKKATSSSSTGRTSKLHVLVHASDDKVNPVLFDDALVYGDELAALRDAVHRDAGWTYVSVGKGESIAEALKAQS